MKSIHAMVTPLNPLGPSTAAGKTSPGSARVRFAQCLERRQGFNARGDHLLHIAATDAAGARSCFAQDRHGKGPGDRVVVRRSLNVGTT